MSTQSGTRQNQGDGWEIIIYRLNSDLSVVEKNKIVRELYGFREHSNYNRYVYERTGLLSAMEYYAPFRSVIITPKEHRRRIVSYLRDKAEVYSFEIRLDRKQHKRLKQLPGKGVR